MKLIIIKKLIFIYNFLNIKIKIFYYLLFNHLIFYKNNLLIDII